MRSNEVVKTYPVVPIKLCKDIIYKQNASKIYKNKTLSSKSVSLNEIQSNSFHQIHFKPFHHGDQKYPFPDLVLQCMNLGITQIYFMFILFHNCFFICNSILKICSSLPFSTTRCWASLCCCFFSSSACVQVMWEFFIFINSGVMPDAEKRQVVQLKCQLDHLLFVQLYAQLFK